MGDEKDKVHDSWLNILANSFPQFDFRQTDVVMAAAEFILFETLISYLCRYGIKSAQKPFFELLEIHTLSVPLLGAFAGEKHPLGLEAPFSAQCMTAIEQCPAVFTADYIRQTSRVGGHIPKPGMMDVLLTTGSKLVSRNLMSFLYPYMGATLRTHQDVLEELQTRQQVCSYRGDAKVQEELKKLEGKETAPFG